MNMRNNGGNMNFNNGGMPNNPMPNNQIPGGPMPNGMQTNMPKPKKGPKVKKEKVQNVSKYSHSRNVLFLLAVVVIAVIGLNIFSTIQLRQTVSVVSLKTSVFQDGIITADNMQELIMTNADYQRLGIDSKTQKRVIVLWEDRDSLVNKYASYYIRKGTPVYLDSIGTDSNRQYSYLYNMDGELLKIGIDANTFGQMLVPGDRINVRAAYTEQIFTLPTEEELRLQQQLGIAPQSTVQKQILLFNNVAVLDILNSSGESIYDKYYEVLALPKEKQKEILNSEEFIESVEPSEILLNVTPEEADRYMSIQANGPTYMMTLLPRTSSNAITEVLNELAVGFARSDK